MTPDAQPPANASIPVSPAPMHVSLIGQADEGGSAAHSGKRIGAVAKEDVAKMLRVIESVACSKDRSTAIESITQLIGTYFPGASVRCGVGGKKLVKLFDRKLGWLGPESTLFDDAIKRWEKLQSRHQPDSDNSATLVVAIPELDGEGRCVVWLDGENVLKTPHEWLIGSLETLRIVFWDRPRRSWLRLPERIRLGATLWSSAAILLFSLCALWPIQYRVSCTAIVEPVQQRLVATPFEATLLESRVRPGDAVKAGDVLVLLDGRPLRLELESVQAEVQQVAKEHDSALATGRIAEAQQLALRKKQLSRQRDLLADRLGRLEVVSPIDGVVVSGDLDRFIGSPLEIGHTIVEVAPLEDIAIEIEIPEYDIGYIKADSETRVRITSAGGESIRTKIDSIYPAAEIRDDRSVFVARIEVDNRDGKLRPGMRGEATTYGPLRPTCWSWIRGSWERVLWWIGY